MVGHLAAFHGVVHALPLTYNKDLQEDKEHLFDTVDTLQMTLAAARGMIAGASFDRERMRAAASDELIAATDVADLLVRLGMPFREAHGVVAGLVRTAIDAGKPLSELTVEELTAQRAARRSARAVPARARPELLARVEGLRGRDLAGALHEQLALARDVLTPARPDGMQLSDCRYTALASSSMRPRAGGRDASYSAARSRTRKRRA